MLIHVKGRLCASADLTPTITNIIKSSVQKVFITIIIFITIVVVGAVVVVRVNEDDYYYQKKKNK